MNPQRIFFRAFLGNIQIRIFGMCARSEKVAFNAEPHDSNEKNCDAVVPITDNNYSWAIRMDEFKDGGPHAENTTFVRVRLCTHLRKIKVESWIDSHRHQLSKGNWVTSVNVTGDLYSFFSLVEPTNTSCLPHF
jgi:hypothetical protein